MIETLKNIQLTEGPKDFWNMIKKMNSWGNENKDDTDKISSNKWHKYFKALLNSDSNGGQEFTEVLPSFEPILDSTVTGVELKTALNDLKRKKLGPDGVLSDYLKVFGEAHGDILLKMINGIFCENVYPEDWNLNYLKPIYKKGDILDPDNYRGIAIGSSFAKLYSLILLNRLIEFIDEKGLMSPNQIGFMNSHRTSDHNFLLQTLIEKSKVHKKKLYVAFIDFKKAYDTVNRCLLFNRLRQVGISGAFYRNIVQMYKNTQYTIKTSKGSLEPILSNLGLRQGCPLSPMLFNLFIDDISDIFIDSQDTAPVQLQNTYLNYFLYADDLVLVSESATGLQNCLNKLESYAGKKSLTVSIKKSKTMIFNPSARFLKEQFFMNGQPLEPVQSFCYLGFEAKPSGTTSHGASILIDKSLKALRPLQRAIANFQLPLDISLRLFHALIEPIAMYNVENWGILTSKQLDNLNAGTLFDFIGKAPIDAMHRKLLRYTLGVNNSAPNLSLYGDTGEIPLSIKGFSLMINFWHHLHSLPEDSLAHLALRENVELRTNWLKTIEKLMNIFDLPEHVDDPLFKNISKKHGKEFYLTKWTEILSENNQSRLKFYKSIKDEFRSASYINLPYHQRKVIAKVRCSSHVLEIEKGRHKKKELGDRLCLMCSGKSIEDEEHFLTTCQGYNELRARYRYNNRTAIEIMSDSNQGKLANFLNQCFKLRKRTLDD